MRPTDRPAWPDRHATRVDTLALTRRRSATVKRLGGYELLREIGSGGMATVWMARRAALGGATKVAAVKLMSRELSEKPRYRDMFLAETRLSMMLSHSNVVQVFDAGEDGGQCYLVMEWLDGMNLAQLVGMLRQRGAGLSLPLSAYIIGEVLRGLAYAQTITHEGAPLGVVHRDVSPQNVLVSVSGEVKLTDFGVARLASDETSGDHAPGKLRYMAPEQLRGRSREPTVDLYAVGAILHELIDGRKFREAGDNDEMYGIVLDGIVPPLRNARDVPVELDELRTRLLAGDPSARLQRAEDALEWLMRWPGYRNASMELARLCRSFVGVVAPRSGVHAQAGLVATPTGDRTETAHPRPAVGSRAAESASAVTAADVVGPPVSGSRPTGSGIRTPARVVGIALGLFAVLGVAVFAGWRAYLGAVDTPASPAAAAQPPVSVVPLAHEPPPPVETPSSPAVEPAPTTETGRSMAMPGPAPASSLAPESTALVPEGTALQVAPAEPTPKAKAKGRAKVTFKTGDFLFVWVKVGGKVLALEPLQTIELPAGRHRVHFRRTDEDAWQPGGSIVVEASRRYEVRMEQPGRARISQL